jgi:hypothetical protein
MNATVRDGRDSARNHVATGGMTPREYERPIRVVAFNTAEGWARDVTEDIGREILDRAHRKGEPLSVPAAAFVEWVTDEDVPANLMDR